MRITKYRTELDNDLHNVLVKENSCNYETNRMDSPDSFVVMLNDVYRLNKQAEECLYMLALNTKNRILGVFEVSHGTVDMTMCRTRDIFIKALLCGASTIILAHNHPSQDATPSKADREACKQVYEAGKLMNIELLDNIIIGNGFYSFRENKIIGG